MRWFLLFLSAAVVLAAAGGVAAAEAISYTTYVEDFEDENGDPAFDPLFLHEFSRETPLPVWWVFEREPVYLTHGWVLMLGGTDTVRFDLEPGQSVAYASVEFRGRASVTFVGTEGQHEFPLETRSYDDPVSAGCEDIGMITAIRLRGGEAAFDNITIRVVPEPSVLVAILIAIAMFAVKRVRNT